MRKASYLLAATVVATTLAGCGGSSTSSGSGNGQTVTSNAVSTALSNNLASTGIVEISYLTGSGRSIPDGLVAVIPNIELTDTVGTTAASNTAALNLNVASYGGPSTLRAPTSFDPSVSPNSRLFKGFNLNVNELDYTFGGVTATIPTSSIYIGSAGMSADSTTLGAIGTGGTFTAPQLYPAYIRSFPGRITSATVLIDQNTFGVNTQNYADPNGNSFSSTSPRGIYEPSNFLNVNNISNTTPLSGVISDYLAFDISGMADSAKPILSTTEAGNVTAQTVYFSGDNYALSGAGSTGAFFELTSNIATSQYLSGTYSNNSSVSGYTAPSGLSVTLPGTYALTQINPADGSVLNKIVSLAGMFRPYAQMITTTGKVVAITFPSSQDNFLQDLVVLNRNLTTGKITDFYYGWIDMQARTVSLFPINTLVSATGTAVSGTINPLNLYNINGAVTSNQEAVRFGTFTLTTPLALQNGDGTTTSYSGGTFNVFRK